MLLINVIMSFLVPSKEREHSQTILSSLCCYFFSIQLLNHSICDFNLLDFCYFIMQISVKFSSYDYVGVQGSIN